MKKITFIGTVLLFTTYFLSPVTSWAQPGSLDLTFDSDGKVTTPVNASGYDDNANSVAIQSDGKIVVVGYSVMVAEGNVDFAIVRYNSDGSLDTGFDTDGKVTTDISGQDEDMATSVLIQSDGKIVVAGYGFMNGTNYNFVVVRYNQDGSLDSSFDSDGIVSTDISVLNDDQAYSLAIQSDGKIVVAGYSDNGSNSDFAVVRYNNDGSIDTGFDSDGKVTTPIGATVDKAHALTIQSNGKIVLVGYSFNGNDSDFAVVRYNTDGSLDTGFDTDGIVTSDINGSNQDIPYAVSLQSDGRIVITGYTFNGSIYLMALARYNTDGSLDASFDNDGVTITTIGNIIDIAYSVAIQGDGKILTAGYSFNGANNDFAIVRYNTDGSLDNSFDSDGMVTILIGADVDMATSMVIQSDGKILVAGQSYISGAGGTGNGNDFAVVRINSNTSGINTIDNKNTNIIIYPNPATDNLTISTSQPTEISICNINGLEILKTSVEKEQLIDIAGFTSGIYFIRTSEGETVKFIKE